MPTTNGNYCNTQNLNQHSILCYGGITPQNVYLFLILLPWCHIIVKWLWFTLHPGEFGFPTTEQIVTISNNFELCWLLTMNKN